jgi:Meiotically up-regulated gene 113
VLGQHGPGSLLACRSDAAAFRFNVYVMGIDGGPQKIGISSDLEARLVTTRQKQSAPVRLIASHERPGGDARLVERVAHTLLAAKRDIGEWFDVGPEEAAEAVLRAISIV